jgi:4-hydroxyproline epimerase
MCGHGTIGVVETLRYLGLLTGDDIALDTPVGVVKAKLLDSGEVELTNVKSYRYRHDVAVTIADGQTFVGDIAWGGNWFYIVHEPEFCIEPARAVELTQLTLAIKSALDAAGITGEGGGEIDHIELTGPAGSPAANSRNFVLCPGGAYDRSPCGTGTSAKLACLYAAGKLPAGVPYVQESVLGTSFRGSVEPVEGGVIPKIAGRAYVTGENTLIFSEGDPLRWGLQS